MQKIHTIHNYCFNTHSVKELQYKNSKEMVSCAQNSQRCKCGHSQIAENLLQDVMGAKCLDGFIFLQEKSIKDIKPKGTISGSVSPTWGLGSITVHLLFSHIVL